MIPRVVPEAGDVVVALPIDQAARAAGIGKNLFREEIQAGRIKVARIGRRAVVRLTELERWLSEREQ
jgi:excisionase family DNA binding protein